MIVLLQVVVAFLLAMTSGLLPVRNDADFAFRVELVEAVVSVTEDLQEQLLLVSIARWESSYRRDVAECRRKGPQGELTAWQILARNDAERARLCVSLAGDAKVALERVRESVHACAALPPEDRLALYARGRCSSAEGRRLSRHRWLSVPKGDTP